MRYELNNDGSYQLRGKFEISICADPDRVKDAIQKFEKTLMDFTIDVEDPVSPYYISFDDVLVKEED